MNTNQVTLPRLVSLLLPGFIVLVIPALFHSLSLASAVQGNTITVTTAVDTLADDGQCSLREAITAANTDAPSGATPGECMAGSGDDVIQLGAATYTLAITGTLEDNNEQGDLDILTDTITIQGISATSTIIQAGTTLTDGVDRVFHVSLPATLVLNQVTVQHGKAAEGTVYPGNVGGGIFNEGVLTITHSYLIRNSTSAFGGAIYSDLFARLRLEHSLIMDNLSYIYGGGLYDVGMHTTILTTTFATNLAGEGGAILFKGADKVWIEATTFSGNQATTLGGAIRNDGARNVTVSRSTFMSNTAARGAGFYNDSLDIDNIYIINSTFSGNLASDTGGGIHNTAGTLDITNVTLAENGAATGGGLYNENFERVNLTNTIIADSTGGNDCATESGTTIFDRLFNMIKDGSCIPIAMDDPMLGPLQNNGGPTLTYSLLPNSPAIDHNPTCISALNRDQRGVTRPQGSGCDVGAIEVEPPTIYIPMLFNNAIP